ncbi:MAG TPA: EF-P lysine aminoacylase EpmA [Pirellulaceae bacterium]|nr:EF-P lysine aminoacylase EpmA [Pirellulaceae bacterium]
MAADFLPTASLPMLRRRAELLKQVRRFFEDRGFLEVETPLLSHDTVVDRHLDPLGATLPSDPRQPLAGPRLWLQTSPEFAMKRLLAAGVTAIYQVTKAFRGGEAGPLHNPEFTIVEWYRVGDDYAAGMQLLSDLAESLLDLGPAERLTYREAFRQFAGVDPFADPMQIVLEDLPPRADGDLVLDYLLTTRVEPHLGQNRPTILHDYPASQAALAQLRPGQPPVAERFELYVRGIELANGYHELLDPALLRDRNRANNELRAAGGKYTLPAESRLLVAMDHGLPACSGCALGFDRLVMVATSAKSIQEVMAFPIERA